MNPTVHGLFLLSGVILGFIVTLALHVAGTLISRLDRAILDLYHNRDKTLTDETWYLLEKRFHIK